jgi:catechol 2,3-dioxygenase-like lactoylglutathione lyase family enzyme
MKLTHVRLLVREFRECFRFYNGLLGLKVVWGEESSGYAEFEIGAGLALALFNRQAMADAIGAGAVPEDAVAQDTAMLVLSVEDLEAEVRRLREAGVNLVRDVEDRPGWGIRTAHLRDPDGTLIELAGPLPREAWTEELKEESDRYNAGDDRATERGAESAAEGGAEKGDPEA